MPQRDTSGIGERVPRELIQADFAIAFSLVEMAQVESCQDNKRLALNLLEKAAQTLDNIRARLMHIGASQKEAFELRCVELADVIELIKGSDSEPEPKSER